KARTVTTRLLATPVRGDGVKVQSTEIKPLALHPQSGTCRTRAQDATIPPQSACAFPRSCPGRDIAAVWTCAELSGHATTTKTAEGEDDPAGAHGSDRTVLEADQVLAVPSLGTGDAGGLSRSRHGDRPRGRARAAAPPGRLPGPGGHPG